MDQFVLPQLNLEFCADRIILRAEGGFQNDPITKNFFPQEKAAIALRHLVDKTPVSDLCDKYGLQPTQIYTWQKQLPTNAALAFQAPRQSIRQDDAKYRKIVALESKNQK